MYALTGCTNRSKCTFCSHSLERVHFKSREVSSDERLRGRSRCTWKQDWREKVNILARLYEIKQCQLLIHPSCGGSCKRRERKKRQFVCPSIRLWWALITDGEWKYSFCILFTWVEQPSKQTRVVFYPSNNNMLNHTSATGADADQKVSKPWFYINRLKFDRIKSRFIFEWKKID